MYGNYYGGGYIPQMQPMPDQLTQLRQSANHPTGGIVWVQGEAAAKSYAVPFGASIPLFDIDGDVFYIKSVDASGMPLPIRVFKYTEITSQAAQNNAETPLKFDMSKYITREELAKILAEMGVSAPIKEGEMIDGE